MIRKVAMFLTLIFVIIFCYNCSSEIDPDKLTFDPINVDENTIFMFDGKDDKVHKIYAIDTKNSKKIYTYEFKKMLIFSFVYDASLDQNPYILLPSGKVLKLDIKAGKIKKIDLDDAQESICITDNKLWMCQSSKDGVGNLYNIYDPKTETIEKKTLSEKGSYYGDSGVINGNRYLPLYYGSASAKIYNLSQERIVNNNLFTKEYTSFNFYLNNYLSSYIAGLNTLDIYFVDSIEPTFIKRFLFSMDITEYLDFVKIFEDDNYIYLVSRENVIKRDKNHDYTIKKIVSFKNKYSGGFYCTNGYIWLVSEENEGAYKVNMDDLSYEVVK